MTWSADDFQRTLPEIYQIEATNACDLRCPDCIRNDPRFKRTVGYFNPELLKIMVSRGDFEGSYFTELQMYGEPTLNNRLPELISILGGIVKIGYSTNGASINNPKNYKNVDRLTISIDSPIPKEYERRRPGRKFEALMAVIDNAIGMVPIVELQVIRYWDQASELPALIELAEERKWNVICREVADSFAAFQNRPAPNRQPGLCLNPWLSVSVQWDGDVVPCCLTPDTPIMTDRGVISIQDILIGDKVLTHRGRFCEVMNTFSRKTDSIFQLSRKCSNQIIGITGEHPIFSAGKFTSVKQMGEGDIVSEAFLTSVKDIDYIHISDYIQPKGPHDTWTRYSLTLDKNHYVDTKYPYLIPLLDQYKQYRELPVKEKYGYCKKLGITSDERGYLCNISRRDLRYIKNKINISHDFLKLVGYYLAEGWSGDGSIKFAFHRDELEYHRDVMQLTESVFGVPSSKKDSKRYKSSEITSDGRSTILGDFFRELFGQYSTSKHIPTWILELPPDKLTGLLEGFVKGDGWNGDQFVGCATSSYNLAVSLYYIFRKCGFEPKVNAGYPTMGPKNNRHLSPNLSYRFGFDVDTSYELSELFGFNVRHPRLGAKHWYSRHSDRTDYELTKYQEIAYDGLVYNIEVDKDNSYTIPFFGTVHNCFAAGKDIVYGNLWDNTMYDIWNYSKEREGLMNRMRLNFNESGMPCKLCYMRSPTLFHMEMVTHKL